MELDGAFEIHDIFMISFLAKGFGVNHDGIWHTNTLLEMFYRHRRTRTFLNSPAD